MPRQDSPLGPEYDDSLPNPITNDNLLRLLRLKNIFSPNQSTETPIGVEGNESPFKGITLQDNMPNGSLAMNMSGSQDEDELSRLMSKLYKPQTEWEDRYESHVGNMPVRDESNKPSMLRKILAGLYGGLTMSPSIAQDIVDQPYERQMIDWETRRKALEPGLTAERFSNTNARQAATSAASNEVSNRRADIAARRVEDQRVIADNLNKTREAELALKTMIANKPDLELIEDEATGKLFGVDKDSGKTFEIPNITRMTEAKKIELGIAGRIKVANVQGQNAINRTREAGNQARQTVRERAKLRIAADKKLSVTQDAAAYRLAQRQFITENPEAAEFFFSDGTPDPDKVDDDPEGYAAVAELIRFEYDKIKERAGEKPIGDVQLGGNSDKPANVNTAPITSKQPKAPPGWKYVPKSDGSGWTAVEDK